MSNVPFSSVVVDFISKRHVVKTANDVLAEGLGSLVEEFCKDPSVEAMKEIMAFVETSKESLDEVMCLLPVEKKNLMQAVMFTSLANYSKLVDKEIADLLREEEKASVAVTVADLAAAAVKSQAEPTATGAAVKAAVEKKSHPAK